MEVPTTPKQMLLKEALILEGSLKFRLKNQNNKLFQVKQYFFMSHKLNKISSLIEGV